MYTGIWKNVATAKISIWVPHSFGIPTFRKCCSIVSSFILIKYGENFALLRLTKRSKRRRMNEWFSSLSDNWWEILLKRQLPSGRTLYNFCPELDKNVADDVVVTYSKAHKDKGSNDWLLIFVLSVHKVSRYRIHTNLTFTLHASNTYSQFEWMLHKW